MKPRRGQRQGVKAFARATSLAGKLTRAAMEASILSVLVSALALNAVLFGMAQHEEKEEAAVAARITADHSAAAVMFDDKKAALETLAILKGNEEVLGATLYNKAGDFFADYRKPDAPAPKSLLFGLVSDRYSVDVPVMHEGNKLGHLTMVVTFEHLLDRLTTLLLVTLLAGAAGVSLAVMRVGRVRRAVKQTEENLDRLAFYDPVTGLHNRHAAKEMLEEYVNSPGAGNFTVALLDLDDFKLVNDTLGHKAGDDLLRNLGVRLREMCADQGTVFRLGGDEFVIVWEVSGERETLEALGQRMVQTLAEPLTVGDRVMFAKASVGLAQFPQHGASGPELLRAADTAMYQAKSAGKNTYALFDASMADSSAQRLQLSTELALAMDRDELVLHYQPIVDIATQALIGVEALVRWPHPQRGFMAAAQFIDIAEESGLVAELGGWVLKAAARQQAEWATQGLGHLFIAVNVSAQQFKRNTLLKQVSQALPLAADPRKIQIELTEHTLIEDVDTNVQSLKQLQELGLAIAIDDFGTGLSSLAYLKRLPINKLKIDRSFVNELGSSREDGAIVEAVVRLSHALGLQVVAEGIEHIGQLQHLQGLHVDHGQGYYFSRPVAAPAVQALAQGFAAKVRHDQAAQAVEAEAA